MRPKRISRTAARTPAQLLSGATPLFRPTVPCWPTVPFQHAPRPPAAPAAVTFAPCGNRSALSRPPAARPPRGGTGVCLIGPHRKHPPHATPTHARTHARTPRPVDQPARRASARTTATAAARGRSPPRSAHATFCCCLWFVPSLSASLTVIRGVRMTLPPGDGPLACGTMCAGRVAAPVRRRRRAEPPLMEASLSCRTRAADHAPAPAAAPSRSLSPSSSSSPLALALLPLLLLQLFATLFAAGPSSLMLQCAAQPAGAAESVLLNSDEMRWTSLSAGAVDAGAVCNDGSTPGFWASLSTINGAAPASASSPSSPVSLSDAAAAAATGASGASAPRWSSKWVLYLEGGGACLDEYSCTLRATDYPDHVSTRNNSRTMPAANLLAADNATNPTAFDHHHVFGQSPRGKRNRRVPALQRGGRASKNEHWRGALGGGPGGKEGERKKNTKKKRKLIYLVSFPCPCFVLFCLVCGFFLLFFPCFFFFSLSFCVRALCVQPTTVRATSGSDDKRLSLRLQAPRPVSHFRARPSSAGW